MINIDQAFNTENTSVFRYFQRPGVGFYIPLYQREYSWDSDNIDQLLEDISKGIENIVEDEEREIRFLGTIITVAETDKNKIQPQDTKALPVLIEKIIDGQQRLSSIALISALLFKQIENIEQKAERAIKKSNLGDEEKISLADEIRETSKFWKDKLLDIFSVDLKRGKPARKPKIIRGSVDKWVMSEVHNTSYISPVTDYLFQFINSYLDNKPFPTFDKRVNAGKNLSIINQWMEKTVIKAHVDDNNFVSASKILNYNFQEEIWQYDRPNLKNIVNDKRSSDPTSISYSLNSLVQIFSVCHYLLDRCCFTVIQPINDDWAFDMFQSLNATGTPLTAIETFKPSIVNTLSSMNVDFKTSIENKYFSKVEDAFGDLKSAAQKSKLTNELLTSFSLPVDGTKLSTHFSSQKKWLEKIYNIKLTDYELKKDFIIYFGNYSEFYNLIWNKYRGENNLTIEKIRSNPESELISLLILYLKDSNHKMSITILASFYNEVLEGKPDSIPNFVKIVKLLTAFYTIWRSAKSNSGLDEVYRTFFKGSAKQNIKSHTWLNNRNFNVDELKEYLVKVLAYEGFDDKATWLAKSTAYLRYDTSSVVCKLALFFAAHDTIPDPDVPGLFKQGSTGCNPYLKIEKWNSPFLKTIEHIAPEKRSSTWDNSLYDEAQLYQSIGNLTLLPLNVNISASNKGWKEKHVYYSHLGLDDLNKIQELANKAHQNGIELSSGTIELLRNSNYAAHIKHIVAFGFDSSWNSEIVKLRANKILECLWGSISKWIY